jgi:hypothetical protein
MTAAGVYRPAPGAAPAPVTGPPSGLLRLGRLFLVGRRAPAAAGLLAGFGAVLWAALHWHWGIAGGTGAQEFVPLVVETSAAAIIAVTTYNPFGETERAAGRWLPWLRLAAAVGLTVAAFGALAAGSTGGYLPGGSLALLRDVGGMTGLGLLCAPVLGGAFAWVGPMAYLVLAEGAFAGSWTTPWMWPTRPPGDLGGALCASLVFVAGVVAVTVWGARQHDRE